MIEVDEMTIDRWKQRADFQALLQEELRSIRDRIAPEGLAVKENRILAKRRRHLAIMKALRKRAGKPDLGGAAWDDSGFFTQRLASVGGGDNFTLTTEFQFDVPLVRELTELEDSIAREKGDHKVPIEIPKPRVSGAVVALGNYLSAAQIEELIRMIDAEAANADGG